jgi:hypothetical protein
MVRFRLSWVEHGSNNSCEAEALLECSQLFYAMITRFFWHHTKDWIQSRHFSLTAVDKVDVFDFFRKLNGYTGKSESEDDTLAL